MFRGINIIIILMFVSQCVALERNEGGLLLDETEEGYDLPFSDFDAETSLQYSGQLYEVEEESEFLLGDLDEDEDDLDDYSIAGVKADDYSEYSAKREYLPYSLKARASAFSPSSHTLRDIYGNCWGQYSMEFDYRFFYHWGVFGNLSYYHRHGHSMGMGSSTTVTTLPMTTGINYYFGGSETWLPYLGAGIGVVYAHFKDCSKCVKKNTSSWGFATFYQLGTEVNLTRHFFLDLFTAYRWNWISFPKEKGVIRNNVQTGGWEVGGGVGYRF